MNRAVFFVQAPFAAERGKQFNVSLGDVPPLSLLSRHQLKTKTKKTDSTARENDPPAVDKPPFGADNANGAKTDVTATVAVVVKKAKKPRCSNPGVRVQGGRIYDSANGTTCHQVRSFEVSGGFSRPDCYYTVESGSVSLEAQKLELIRGREREKARGRTALPF